MPVTLAQAQLNTQADIDFAVIDNLRRNSWLFNNFVWDDTLITGTAANPYGVPSPVVKTCMFMAAAVCSVPQMKSLAGVAANTSPLVLTRSPGRTTPWIAVVPALATEPSAFSTMFDNPPRLLPGVGLALRSASPRSR